MLTVVLLSERLFSEYLLLHSVPHHSVHPQLRVVLGAAWHACLVSVLSTLQLCGLCDSELRMRQAGKLNTFGLVSERNDFQVYTIDDPSQISVPGRLILPSAPRIRYQTVE